MKIAVTGANGHLGATLIPKLLEAGYEVRAMVHGDASCVDGLAVECIEGDVRNKSDMLKVFAGQEIAIHMAAFISVSRRDAPVVREVNVGGVQNAAEAALEQGVRRFVHVSSVHAFHTYKIGRPLTEVCPKAVQPTDPAYDQSKAAGEAVLRQAIAKGLDATILNPVGIMGPNDHRPSLAGRELLNFIKGKSRFVPTGGFPWVDVRDVVAAIIAAIENGARGKNYLLSGEYSEMTRVFRATQAASGLNRSPIVIPLNSIRPFASAAEAFGKLVRYDHGFTPAALHAIGSDLTVDCSRANQELGFKARPIEETIQAAYDWWKANGYLS